jgi:hypothetical protein
MLDSGYSMLDVRCRCEEPFDYAQGKLRDAAISENNQ